jgi:hypothetical protein
MGGQFLKLRVDIYGIQCTPSDHKLDLIIEDTLIVMLLVKEILSKAL